ncbi:unnamed protein product [Parnassius apollo]|uniref:(apollo) hypothetical protein n=1 Tax=Parnassius apollo TaxID=110799 RepID=A0A8S3X3J0_PARAO|nr:unnamed protein product [Parnassius apollo]
MAKGNCVKIRDWYCHRFSSCGLFWADKENRKEVVECVPCGLGLGYAPGFAAKYGAGCGTALANELAYGPGLGLGYGLAGPAGIAGPAYGGAGIGDVAVAGEVGVAGTTFLTGQVPILGDIRFGGEVPAGDVVSIAGSFGGNCGCVCNGVYLY